MLKSLQYASELEMLGYSCSLPGFDSCNKLELVMGIWRSQCNNPQALILIARMCVEFNIQQHNIWTLLLKQMTKYSMVSAHCLLQTFTHCSLTLSLYKTAWCQFVYTISAGTADILCLNRIKSEN